MRQYIGWRSTVVRTFKKGCTLGKDGRGARRWALAQAADAARDMRLQQGNTPGHAKTSFEDLIANRLTDEQVMVAMRAGSAGPGIQRRAASELARLMTRKKPGPIPRSKIERDPALALASELSLELIAYLRVRGSVERHYAIKYAVAIAWALLGKRVKLEKVHGTLNRPAPRNFGKP